MDYMPVAIYESPSRLGRGRKLNTILEDQEQMSFGVRSDSDTDSTDSTIILKHVGGEPKQSTAPVKKSRLAFTTFPTSPISECSSGCNSAGSGMMRPDSVRSSDDDVTVFSETCPSLSEAGSSEPTVFDTDSSRNSVSSTKSTRNRYPALSIPQTDSWHSIASPTKDLMVQMSPHPRIPLSPAVLSALPKWVPAINAPPSLGDASSITSESPSIPGVSAPVTPEVRMVRVVEGDSWGGHDRGRRPTVLASPREEIDQIQYSPQDNIIIERDPEEDWSDIVGHFPRIPGATPEENSPINPLNQGEIVFPDPMSAISNFRLPADALRTLEHLVGERSPSPATESQESSRAEEMMEVTVPPSRPRSADGETPLSNYSAYSFSQLSIPSPGGFFSSLKAGTRHTWCMGGSNALNPPSSTTAENFYNVPWNQPDRIIETVLEADDTDLTEGPPTARQPVFDTHVKPLHRPDSPVLSEDGDLYGPPANNSTAIVQTPNIRYEYEEEYEHELKHAAEANIDRTSTWLAAQTTYMSALRETNPVNDLSDPSAPTIHPSSHVQSSPEISPVATKAVHFLTDPSKTTTLTADPENPKDLVFQQALQHLVAKRQSHDPFLHAKARLDAVASYRITLTDQHVSRLLGNFSIASAPRPKYSGPFSQNPRTTGIFELTDDQAAFRRVEREQFAMDSIAANCWSVDALRYLYGGRILASPGLCNRLTTKSKLPLSNPSCVGRKRLRVLDLGGNANCSWSWHVANQWPNVKVYTVLTKTQAEAQAVDPAMAGPSNHRQVSVPHLWQLPFRDNHFDVVSARSLHALLKAEPVPGVRGIDEYDMCLKECMRILKPGGYLEFFVMDSTIAKAGARGEALSVEFGFMLKMRGYEREATKNFLPRLRRLGFVGAKRAWIFLPMGTSEKNETVPTGHGTVKRKESGRDGGATWKEAPRPMSEVSVSKILDEYLNVEAVQGPVGSTADAANISGLLGGWMWESWLVKLRSEVGREKARLLDGVAAVVEEGRECGAGWRVLSGWARKPAPPGGGLSAASSAASGFKKQQNQAPKPTVKGSKMIGEIPIGIQDV